MILASTWNQDPMQLNDTAVVAALNECLCCLTDLRLRLWRSQTSGCHSSIELLTRSIEVIEHEARRFTSEVLTRPQPATLVGICDTLTITTTESPRMIQQWLRLRLDDLISRLIALGSSNDAVTHLTIEEAAARIAAELHTATIEEWQP